MDGTRDELLDVAAFGSRCVADLYDEFGKVLRSQCLIEMHGEQHAAPVGRHQPTAIDGVRDRVRP